MNILEFETNRKIAVGDKVIAIGNPSGLDYSVTEGIISAKNRELDNQPRDLEFIQTDVAINYGNSGGPLINLNKKVVGVNTLIIANTQGLGFAVSNDNTEEFIDNIFTQLNVTR